jgi:hypothetical protein
VKKRYALLFVCFAFAIASAVRAQNSGVNNAELKGDYAFTFNGFTGSSGSATVSAAVGRFTADGAGNVTNGVLDGNGVNAGSVFTAQPFTGAYTIGADNRGTLTLNIAGGTATFAFAMMANGNAELIRFDAAGGTGTVGSGTLEKADRTAFSTARITGDYAFGLAGLDSSSNRLSFAGRFTSDGAGTLASAASDINARGTYGPAAFTSSTYTVSDTANGRGTTSWSFVFYDTSSTLNFVFYVVNSGRLLVMETDSVAGGFPLLNGAIVQQQTPTGGFSNASLSGGVVIYLTGRAVCTSGAAAASDVVVGLLTADGSGGYSVSYDENCGGAVHSFTTSGTDAVAPNGRVAMTFAGAPESAYLIAPNQFFFLASEPAVYFGPGDPQAQGALDNSSVRGSYAGFATDPVGSGARILSGEFSADGASPTGNLTGSVDIGAASGAISGAAFAATYSISSTPLNGRGTVTITSPAGLNAIAYVITPTKFAMLPVSDASPSIWLFEPGPPAAPPAPTLTSLTLNPTTVVGGQSATGTVTLSGPAPAGGVVVALSSSNPAVAQVPPSGNVTVPAGATSVIFTVATSAVNTSTSVVISAAYSGVTRTASLTVTPPPPPPATLTSLTLSPSGVIGGIQSSSGTVTLSGPAPAGGVVVALSSSNPGAAQVPGSVTVPTGATSASFTVTTSVVLISTSVQISASYNGTTRAAILDVLL